MDQDRQNSQNHDTEHAGRDREFATYRTAQSSNDMVPTVFRRGIYRTIRGSLKRFLSIVVITALGVSVMCGLKAGCEDLCDSVDAYFDQQNVYDINVQSTYGLTRDDLAAIQEVDGVETAEGIYTETAYTAVGTTRERVVVQSLSKENIDQPVLVNGDLPESADEVAVTSKFLKASGKRLGDTVSFAANDASSSNQSAKDQFAAGDYTITAEVLDPTDVSSDSTVNAFRAASAADYKFYVSEDAATSSSYSAVHVIVEGAKSLNSYSDAYTAKINEVKGNIEKIREEREKARAQELTVDTPASLDAAERQAAMLFGIEQDNINRMAEGSDERVQAQAELDQRRAAADQYFADARAELSNLGECTWYIQDRGNIASYSSVESDSSSIEAIATVFPFIFFVVAVLISLTTATRMVEEERTLIGLYKALGYSRERILSKYVDYALWACLIGGVLGNIIGFVGLPLFLFTVFDDMYSLPQMLLSYDIVSSIVSVALFAVGVVGATIIACRHEMAETPASLMRPKAPRAGSRILLERIGFIWHRMGFLNKVAARNLFRYKKRAFMTIFGIAGCTALVICGMGIRDTSVALSPKQYGHITRYDLLAVANPDDFSQTCAALDERSAANDSNVTVTSMLPIMTDNVTFTFGGKSETVQLIVVDSDSTDGTAAVLERYRAQPGVVLCNCIAPRSAAAARNEGLRHAVGRWLMFVDSDDLLLPGAIRTLLEAAQRLDADVVQGGWQYLYTDGSYGPVQCYPAAVYIGNAAPERFELPGMPWGKIYRRELFAQVRFPAYYTCFEDAIIHFLVFRLAKTVASVPEMVYLWRKNPKGLTATSQHHPAAVQSYWIMEQLLAQDAALGLPHDALYRCSLTLQLSAFCYATVSGLPPETQQAVFRLCCALYAKALPQEGALPRRARWGARALRQQDFGLWCRYGRRFQLL